MHGAYIARVKSNLWPSRKSRWYL